MEQDPWIAETIFYFFFWKLSLSPNTHNNLIPFKTYKAIRNSVVIDKKDDVQ